MDTYTVRPDNSTGSLVNAALSPPSVRPELVEGYERENSNSDRFNPSTGSGRTVGNLFVGKSKALLNWE